MMLAQFNNISASFYLCQAGKVKICIAEHTNTKHYDNIIIIGI